LARQAPWRPLNNAKKPHNETRLTPQVGSQITGRTEGYGADRPTKALEKMYD